MQSIMCFILLLRGKTFPFDYLIKAGFRACFFNLYGYYSKPNNKPYPEILNCLLINKLIWQKITNMCL